ncbi:MAG: hypothetical protein AB7O65_00375 [Candidatus Korobacteraceae bacterium]
MQKQSRIPIWAVLLVTIFRPVVFVCGLLYKILFSWWLDPWGQRRKNEALWRDLQAKFYFLTSSGKQIEDEKLEIAPFDYAYVTIVCGDLGFYFSRGRGAVSVILWPVRFPDHKYSLERVLAFLNNRPGGQIVETLDDASDLLRSRFDQIREAFSETKYEELRDKLAEEEKSESIRIREAEWNKRIYGSRY